MKASIIFKMALETVMQLSEITNLVPIHWQPICLDVENACSITTVVGCRRGRSTIEKRIKGRQRKAN